MAPLFQRLPGSRRAPPGRERTILRRLPTALLGVTLATFLFVWATDWFAPELSPAQLEQRRLTAEILAFAVLVTAWVSGFTIALGCLIVRVMKGPAYVADRYELVDADAPRQASATPARDPAPTASGQRRDRH